MKPRRPSRALNLIPAHEKPDYSCASPKTLNVGSTKTCLVILFRIASAYLEHIHMNRTWRLVPMRLVTGAQALHVGVSPMASVVRTRFEQVGPMCLGARLDMSFCSGSSCPRTYEYKSLPCALSGRPGFHFSRAHVFWEPNDNSRHVFLDPTLYADHGTKCRAVYSAHGNSGFPCKPVEIRTLLVRHSLLL